MLDPAWIKQSRSVLFGIALGLVARIWLATLLVPMAGFVRSGVVLRRAWDQFAVAWPFARVDVVLGAPIDPERVPDARHEVERALVRMNAASRIL